GHGDSDKNTGNDGSDDYSAEGLGAEGKADDNRCEDRDQAGNDHFFQGGFGDDVDAGGIIRLAGAFHDPLDFAELATDFNNYGATGLADRFHALCSEVVGEHAADKEAYDDVRVGEVEFDECLVGQIQRMIQLVNVGG